MRLQDPVRDLRSEHQKLVRSRHSGEYESDGEQTVFFPYTGIGRTRLDHIRRCLDVVRTEPIEGDLVECGTLRGGGAIMMRGYLEAYEMRTHSVWVADRFQSAAVDGLVEPGSRQPGGVGTRGRRELITRMARGGCGRFERGT